MNRYTPIIEGKSSISVLESLVLGGIEQSVLIRGESINNPIILFLHGGPGNAQIGWAPKFQSYLEKNFVVVNWDQRGSGLSYFEGIPEETMNINQFIQDAYELTMYLLNKFNKNKIFVVGHSWGTIIGMSLIQKYPELFHAYFGVGQGVDFHRGERLSYQFTLEYAKNHQVIEAIQELSEIGAPPYEDMFKGLFTQRKWLNQFGGVVAKDSDFFSKIIKIIQERPEYLEEDIERLQNGNSFSIKSMWAQVLTVNFLLQIKEVNIPVYFFMGEYDYNTPNKLVEEFYTSLVAPYKEKIEFKGLAHCIPFEDPKLFSDTLYQLSQRYINY
ncbi:alpha/beta hydrolase [Alkalihalobacterium elongatum]|uniref:alpha/beta hydrolase n=1 Tax=Alkalihalobacterium elongatum TaxID=2675466 RepID=UPI001C1F44CA|nr:alpha/beta hydrolase [Alkalihalobacterium elongatum]